jgi:glucose/arabinose dehydrogenase
MAAMNQSICSGVVVVWTCALAGSAGAQTVEQMWAERCASCHGDKAQGTSAPTLLTKEKRDLALVRPFFESIMNGREGLDDHAFGQGDKALSDKQAYALTVRIREMQEAARFDAGEYLKPVNGVYHSQRHDFRMETVIKEGLSTPWAIEFLSDGRLLITNKNGKLMVARGEKLTTVEGTPAVIDDGQGGLLDTALHPEFEQNGWVYLSFQFGEAKKRGMTKIVRGRLKGEGNSLRWVDEQTIYEAKAEHYMPAGGVHFGCRIAFQKHPDGKWCVYFTHGERGRAELAQDVSRPNGKVHRLYDDGTVPADNPFVDDPRAYPSIWSFGHRNPQGLTFDLDGNLWDTEHGPRGGDELNRVERGRNYGWPLVSFGINYDGTPFRNPWPELNTASVADKDIAMPTFIWLPSIAACGLDVSTGGTFPEWKGDLLAGGLAGMTLQRVRVRDGKVVEVEEVLKNIGRVRDVRVAPDGTVFLVINQPDIVVRLVNTSGT